MDNLFEIIDVMAISQGIILGVVLMFLRRNKRVSVFLGLFLITYVLEFIPVTFVSNSSEGISKWSFLPIYFYFLNVPLLYIYCRKLTGEIKTKLLIAILLPGIIEFVGMSSLFILNYFSFISESSFLWWTKFQKVYYVFALLYSMGFIVLSLRHLVNYRHRAVNYYSRLDGKVLQWLMNVLKFLLIFDTIYCVLIIFSAWAEPIVDIFYAMMSVINVFIVYWVALSGYHQSQRKMIVFTENQDAPEETELDLSELFVRLVKYFQEQKPYTNSDLNIQTLALEMDVNYKKLSKAINENTNENFNTFVNKFRVEAAKEMLLDSDYNNFSILAIGYEAGFNSKASFYSAFKRFTQSTPLQFKGAGRV